MRQSLRTAIIGVLLIIIVGPTLAGDRAMLQDEEDQAAWREDITAMVERMERIHPNLFWRIPEPEFRQIVDTLSSEIPYLTDNQIMLELANLASFGGGHTYVWLLQEAIGFHLYPLQLYWFEDGLYVLNARDESLIGAKVLSVGNASTEAVFEQVKPYISNDNDMAYLLWSPLYFVMPEVLEALGIVEDINEANFVLETTDGEQITINPSPISFGAYLSWNDGVYVGLPENREALALSRHLSENFWSTYLEDSNTLYIQYNAVQFGTPSGGNISTFSQELAEFIDQNDVEKIVVDVRYNGGGDNTTYRPLLSLLSQNETVNQPDRLFVLTGRYTFSAAMNFVTDVEQQTEALFVGEATGSRPNHYGDSVPFQLPNSNITVNVSPQYLQDSTPEDTRPWIEPNLPVGLTAEAYFSGQDPVLEAVLSYENP